MSPHWEIGTATEGIEPVAPRALASIASIASIAPFASLASAERIDPYIVWAGVTHYRDLGGMPGGLIPIAIEMKRGGDTARQFAETIERNGWDDWIWMSALYRDPPPALEATRFCTAHVTREFFTRLHTDLAGRFERFTEALALGSPGDAFPSALRVDRAPLMHAPPRAELGSVIVGVCDESVTFAHPRFWEDASGARTRFQGFWNHNDSSDATAGLGYGRELLKHQMDALLADMRQSPATPHASGGARIYGFAHDGAAVAELAGRYPARALGHGIQHDAPLPMIGVQLRKRCRAMRAALGPCPDAELLDAVRYVVQRAQDLGGAACHALVSVSECNAAWQQDGSSLIECALDELMDAGACSVIFPSGNADLSRCRGGLTIDDRAELRWPVRAHASSPSIAEIWLNSSAATPEIDVQIVPPGGIESAWLTRGDVGIYTRGGDPICTVVHLGRGARGDGHMILVALAPTAARSGMRRAEAGQWLIRLRNNGRARVSAQAWMQCDESSDATPLLSPTHTRGGDG